MNRSQWLVLLAAWLGWGFDAFDAVLLNYVAPNCVPTLLHLRIGSAEAASATLYWLGLLNALLLLGWAVGGILFGPVADRIGRRRTLLLTMVLYAVGTAACAGATNLGMLALFRLIASLGIGGEWAAGASIVAEVVPERRRVEAGAILHSAAPLGLVLATAVNFLVAGVWLPSSPETSWRLVFLSGLMPIAFVLFVRKFLGESEAWSAAAARGGHPRIAELFAPQLRRSTASGLVVAVTGVVTWWGCNAFIPIVVTGLAQQEARLLHLTQNGMLGLTEDWKLFATNAFNLGGFLGALLTIPISKWLGRRATFAIYFLGAALAIFSTFAPSIEPETRLRMYFAIGLTVFGVIGAFAYYLPELFPTRVRATGAGFCYNAGRVLAAAGTFAVGSIAATHGRGPLNTLSYVGFVPLFGLLFVPWIIETRGRDLER